MGQTTERTLLMSDELWATFERIAERRGQQVWQTVRDAMAVYAQTHG
jgi:hypothetical protein